MEPAERERLLGDVEAFCQAIRPIEDTCYRERRFNDRVVPLAREYDLLGIPIPRAYGGRGADAVTHVQALARIGREGTGLRTFFSGHTSIGQGPIAAWGSEEQKRRFLPRAVRGEILCAFALTEPEAGSNPREMRMTYRRQGDDFVLNGEKYLISNGGIADLIVTFARSGQEPEPEPAPAPVPGPISAFLVETHGPGFSSESLEPKVGNVTADTVRFVLRDHVVPAANLLGVEGKGLAIALSALVGGRLSVAAGCLGVIEDCLAEVLAYARARRQHGKPIAQHQLVQEHITAIEMARLTTEALVLEAARAKDASDADHRDPAARAQADLRVAQAKLHAARASCEAADRAVQVFGGRGFLEAFRPGRHFQDTRVTRLYEGTDEILTLKIAAAILGKEYEAFH
jgi:alkylation response protein AidB-like acyl-CoA dehydrogenase